MASDACLLAQLQLLLLVVIFEEGLASRLSKTVHRLPAALLERVRHYLESSASRPASNVVVGQRGLLKQVSGATALAHRLGVVRGAEPFAWHDQHPLVVGRLQRMASRPELNGQAIVVTAFRPATNVGREWEGEEVRASRLEVRLVEHEQTLLVRENCVQFAQGDEAKQARRAVVASAAKAKAAALRGAAELQYYLGNGTPAV